MAITKLGTRRRGSMFILTIIVVLLLGLLVAAAFPLIHASVSLDSLVQIENQEQLDVANIMAQARDFITNFNLKNRRNINDPALHNHLAEEVLRSDRALAKVELYNYKTVSFNDLSDMEVWLHELNSNPPLASLDLAAAITADGWNVHGHKIKLKVYDSNYRPNQIKFTPGFGMPPSLAKLNKRDFLTIFHDFKQDSELVSLEEDTGDFRETEADREPGIGFEPYRDYGAYTLQVDVYRKPMAGGEEQRHVNRTEESFYIFLPHF